MSDPLRCDVCGGEITEPGDSWLQWFDDAGPVTLLEVLHHECDIRRPARETGSVQLIHLAGPFGALLEKLLVVIEATSRMRK